MKGAAVSTDAHAQEFLTDFATMSSFGQTARGGVDREAMTEADVDQRNWLGGWLEERGFSVEVDRVGNQFGLYRFTPDAPFVLFGSHMDSQPTAGRFDGAYGVLAAAHAAHRVVEAHKAAGTTPKYNIGVVNWFNEEGSRFEPSMMGSGVYTGKLDADTVLKTEDLDGTSVEDALRAGGYLGTGEGPQAAAYGEIHVEQGRLMEDAGKQIGLVEATWAAHKYHLIVHGEQAHTGSTVIADRHDALLGASHLVIAAREIADEFGIHSSVGQMVVLPNSPVVVPSEVRMHMDFRSPSQEKVEQADAKLKERIKQIEVIAAVRIEEGTAHAWDKQAYHDSGVELSRQAAEDLGLSHMNIMTVAGHDSTNMKDIVPTVMLFVPSVEGVSHNEEEFTTDEDMVAGVEHFTEVVRRMADGALD